ncbi:MAG: hypothetical protein KF690_03165 [Bacteroidetes bacterium]|nr:hypothetical protein [Bacteroidota bacterium]
MKRLYIFCLLTLAAGAPGILAQAPQLHLLVNAHEVVYTYADHQPNRLQARFAGDAALLQECQELAGQYPDLRILIKGFPDTPYELLAWLLEHLRGSGLGSQVVLAHLTADDLAMLGRFPKLPSPTPPDAPDELVILLTGSDTICYYLKEMFPHYECFLFEKERTKTLLGDYDERVFSVAFGPHAGMALTKTLMTIFQEADIPLFEVRQLTPRERKAMGIPQEKPEEDNGTDMDE